MRAWMLGMVLALLTPATAQAAVSLEYRWWFGLTNSTAVEALIPVNARTVLRLQYVSGRYGDGNPRDDVIGWSQTRRLQADVGRFVTPRTLLYAGYATLSHRAEDTNVTWHLVGPVVGLRGTAPLSGSWSVAYDLAFRPWNQFVHDLLPGSIPSFGTEARVGVQYRPSSAVSVEAGYWRWWWGHRVGTDAVWAGPYLGVVVRP